MRSTFRAAARLVLFLSAWTPLAAAAEPPPLVPPVALGSIDVPYPPDATGEAVVLLELVVEKDGTVSVSKVVDGVEPFAEHARRAALGFRFEPAHRGDTAVRARINARIAFRQDAPVEAAPAPGVPGEPADAPAATQLPPPATEVTVEGARRDVGQTTLSAREVREMPGAFGDPFRAIEALPGVVPAVSGFPYFFIRGAPPTNNGYFVDGIRVPVLFHVGVGAGVIHPGLVDRIDFHAGAPPAKYGGFAGAIIAAETRPPAASAHGQANLRLFDAGALLESPFAGSATALVAGRYGYPGPIVGAISDTELDYWDYQARATVRVGERDELGVLAFGSHDYLAAGTPRKEQFVSDFHRLDLRYDHALTGGALRAAATLGRDSGGSEPTYIEDTSVGARVELDQRVAPAVRARGGASVHLDRYGFDQTEVDPQEPVPPSSADPPPTNVTAGVHADVVWRLDPRVEIVPGARVDLFESTRRDPRTGMDRSTAVPAFDPRLATRVTLAPGLAWLGTVGISHQYPVLRVGNVPPPVASVPGFPLGSEKLQTVAQTSQGAEVTLPGGFVATATGFLSIWSGLTDVTSGCLQILQPVEPPPDPEAPPPLPPPYVCPDDGPVGGRAFGVELLVRRSLSRRLSGFVSYTLSRSTREAHYVTLSGDEVVATVPSEGDRTHVLNAALGYDLGRRYRLGGRFVLLSGTPYSKFSGSVPVPPYNDHRAPPFLRLDVRFEKRWPFGKEGSIAFVIEGQNVTLSRETTGFGQDCMGELTPSGGTNRCKVATIGPITIPSIGVEAFF